MSRTHLNFALMVPVSIRGLSWVGLMAMATLAGCALKESEPARVANPNPISATQPITQYNVRSFGAVGDGTTMDTKAFQKALDTCAVNGGGEVLVPAGHYLIGSVQIGTQTILRLEKETVITGSNNLADYPLIDIRWEGRWQQGHRALIYSANVDHTGIVGPGRIEGNREVAASNKEPRGAVVLEPISCNDVRWEDFSIVQPGNNWATHPTYCNDVIIKNLNIQGQRDGVDIDSCKNVRIEGCTMNTGDDSISIKSGRGMDGARLARATENVLITGCTLIDRTFACVGIGSETSGGVKNIRIEHCKLTPSGRQFAIYIKSSIGRGGVIEGIFGDDLDILAGGFLKINIISAGNTNTAADPVEGLIGYPLGKNYHFSNIRMKNATAIAEAADISPRKPLDGFSLTNLSGTARKGITIAHTKNAVLKDINVTGFAGPKVAIDSVTGTGLEGAALYVQSPPTTPRRGAGGRGPRTAPPAEPATSPGSAATQATGAAR